jgi:hypothetical protein
MLNVLLSVDNFLEVRNKELIIFMNVKIYKRFARIALLGLSKETVCLILNFEKNFAANLKMQSI